MKTQKHDFSANYYNATRANVNNATQQCATTKKYFIWAKRKKLKLYIIVGVVLCHWSWWWRHRLFHRNENTNGYHGTQCERRNADNWWHQTLKFLPFKSNLLFLFVVKKAAASIGNAAIVDLLLSNQADCFVADQNGWTVNQEIL